MSLFSACVTRHGATTLRLFAFALIATAQTAWAQQVDAANSPAAADARPASIVQTDFALSIDGLAVMGTGGMTAGAKPRDGSSSPWIGGFSTHALARDDNDVHPLNRAGENFTIEAKRGDESWRVELSALPQANGAYEINARFLHNDAFVREVRVPARDGARVELASNATDAGGTSGVRLGLIVKHIDASTLSAEQRAHLAERKPEAAEAAPAANAPPSADMQTRRMHPPRYPPEAVRAGVQGKVLVNVLIDEQGMPTLADVFGIEPPSAVELGGPAVAAALQWRYKPGRQNGRAVGGALTVPVDFTLSGGKIDEPDPARPLGASYRRLSPPIYPAHAIANGVEGTLYALVEVGADGRATTARVEAIDPPAAAELGEAAIEAIKTWQFSPQTLDGRTSASIVRVPFRFRLAQNEAASVKPALAISSLPAKRTLQLIEVVAPGAAN